MNNQENNTTDWLFEITPKTSSFSLNLKKFGNTVICLCFSWRDVVTVYKQTVLGPALVFDTTLVYPLLLPLFLIIWWNKYGNRVRFCSIWPESRSGITYGLPMGPQILLCQCGIFGKVYFLRIVPISIVISNLLKFGISFAYLSLLFILLFSGCRHKFKCHKVIRSNCSDGDLGRDWECLFPLVTKYRDFSYSE
jgi:lipopolysaccharide transport system permease protein